MRNRLSAALDRLRGRWGDHPNPDDADPESDAGAATPTRDRLLGTTRRGLLARIAGAGAVAGGAKAVDNVLLGYGVLVGTNLRAQALGPLFTEHLTASDRLYPLADGRTLVYEGDHLRIGDGDETAATLDLAAATPATAAGFDASHDLPGTVGPAEQLTRDLAAIRADDVVVEGVDLSTFFGRARTARTRPFTVGTLRGPFFDRAAAATVADATGTDPANPAALVDGLATTFREGTDYDLQRYAAGSVEDNVLAGAVDLRQFFETDVDYDAIARDGDVGLFCYEYTRRVTEAFHAVAPTRQAVPVASAEVKDDRHKHVYSALTTAVREDGELRLLATFLDYTHVALYDDLRARAILGDGLTAYDDRHRATEIRWY